VSVERLAVMVLAGGVGWCLGWLSARATEWLSAEDAERKAPNNPLVRDPLVQGGSALVWAGAALALPGEWWRWVEAGLLSVPLVQVAVTDLRFRSVYTAVAGAGILIGLALGWHFHGVQWWSSLAGAVGGYVAFAVLYLLGRLMYRSRGGEPMARGDLTIAAMVGASAAACAAQALVLGMVLSGLFGLGVWVVHRSRHVFMPYGPGLCLAGIAMLFLC
jgi:hypothetical protein